jgi:sugar/nucleoside kinase (ribokinase family)
VKRVLVAGELNVDIILQGYHKFPTPGQEVLVDDFVMVLGSASAICAMGLARLGNPVSFLGKVGDDPWGRYCLDALTSRGIDVARVLVDPAEKTGVTVAITSPRDRALVSFLGAINSLTPEDLPSSVFAGFQHLHVSSFFLQDRLSPGLTTVFARAHQAGLTTSLDPGFDPSERWDSGLRAALGHVDVFFPNEVELQGLSGSTDPAESLRRLDNGRTLIIAKLGADGSMALEKGAPVRVPSFSVAPLDTTGAGDSFNSGFLHAWLRGAPLLDSLRLGSACGALSTLGLGGTARQPTLEEAEALLAGAARRR